MTPAISVVIAFFNAERFLREAVESVLAQTFLDWELILVDDGSSDGSSQIAREFAARSPERIHYFEHPAHQNRGTSASRNVGLRHARGEFVSFLDSDDLWFPQTLEQQMRAMETHPTVAMAYASAFWWYGWTGQPGDAWRDASDNIHSFSLACDEPVAPPLALKHFLSEGRSIPCPSAVVVRRSSALDVGGFEENFTGVNQLYEDQVLFAKLALRRPVVAVSDCWAKYRRHADSCCGKFEQSPQAHSARLLFLNWLHQESAGSADLELRDTIRQQRSAYRESSGLCHIDQLNLLQLDPRLLGRNIEGPQSGAVVCRSACLIVGWVVARDGNSVQIRCTSNGDILAQHPIDGVRPDVEKFFNQVKGSRESGFRVSIELPTTNAAIAIDAVLADGEVIPMATLGSQPTSLGEMLSNGKQKNEAARGLVLMYHRIASPRVDPWGIACTPEHFAAHLEILNRYLRPVPFAEFPEAVKDRNSPPPVALTFDDGYADNVDNAMPLLQRAGIPATFFLTAGYICTDQLYWWDELLPIVMEKELVETSRWHAFKPATKEHQRVYREIYDELFSLAHDVRKQKLLELRKKYPGYESIAQEAGRPLGEDHLELLRNQTLVEVGAHTMTHPSLALWRPDVQRYELSESKRWLEERLDRSIDSFAYPFGGTKNVSQTTVDIARECGFKHACTTQSRPVVATDDPLQIPRKCVENFTAEQFEEKLVTWLNEEIPS